MLSTPSWAQEVVAGCTLLDRYRVLRKVGEGGFGRVYQAERLLDRQPVALKIGRSTEHEGRMDREARLAALLQSPHSVRVLGVERLEDQSPMIVMEFLEGMSLKEYLAMRGRVEPRLALDWALELTGALEEAHGIGLVHRDIKPSNLFLVESEPGASALKLLDFGLARAPERSDEFTVTRSDLLLGSPAYMSPEQIRGGDVSPQSDIWSFGVVLYEMLSGRRPFHADHDAGLLAAITADIPVPLLEICPHLPVELSRLLDRCLCKKASGRFGDAGELAARLRKIHRKLDGSPPISWAESVGETSPLPRDRRFRTWVRRAQPWLGAVELGTLALGVGLWVFTLDRGNSSLGVQVASEAEAAPRVASENKSFAPSAHVVRVVSRPEQADSFSKPDRLSPSADNAPKGAPSLRRKARKVRRGIAAQATGSDPAQPAPAGPEPPRTDGQPEELAPGRVSATLFAEPDF